MSSSLGRFRPAGRLRCTRCTRRPVVVVAAAERSAALAACAEHMEWAFFAGVDEWSGRRRAA